MGSERGSSPWLSAAEAAHRLGVKPATLYAYVSRGQLRRRPAPDGRRSEYHAHDVADLAVRGRRARPTRPSDVIIPTAITRIDDVGPHYRGRPATLLAGEVGFEVVAELLWDGDAQPVSWGATTAEQEVAHAAVSSLGRTAAPADVVIPVVAAVRAADPLRAQLDPPVVRATTRRVLSLLAGTSARPSSAADDVPISTQVGGPSSVAASLADRVRDPAVVTRASATALLDAALILLADHELAASTLAVRVAASARCDPYGALLAGASVVTGARHGAASYPLERALADLAAGRSAADALERAVRGGSVPGFGHPRYPAGDPRAVRLLDLLEASEVAERAAPVRALLDLAEQRGLPPPSIDVALAAVTYALGAAPGTGELVFTVARTAGWMAHALEQYADPALLRPTAVYVGE